MPRSNIKTVKAWAILDEKEKIEMICTYKPNKKGVDFLYRGIGKKVKIILCTIIYPLSVKKLKK